jgi:hypothetical protein
VLTVSGFGKQFNNAMIKPSTLSKVNSHNEYKTDNGYSLICRSLNEGNCIS